MIAVKDGVALARLDGRLIMRQDFYHKLDGNTVETSLLGYVTFEPASGKLAVAVRSE